MGAKLINLKARRSAARLERLRLTDPVVVEIVLALWELGGQAHRQTVADHVLRGRGEMGVIRHEDRAPIYQAMNSVFSSGGSGWIAPAFGETSYRWVLTDSGQQLFQTARPPKRSRAAAG